MYRALRLTQSRSCLYEYSQYDQSLGTDVLRQLVVVQPEEMEKESVTRVFGKKG